MMAVSKVMLMIIEKLDIKFMKLALKIIMELMK